MICIYYFDKIVFKNPSSVNIMIHNPFENNFSPVLTQAFLFLPTLVQCMKFAEQRVKYCFYSHRTASF